MAFVLRSSWPSVTPYLMTPSQVKVTKHCSSATGSSGKQRKGPLSSYICACRDLDSTGAVPNSSKPQPLPGFSHSLHLVHPRQRRRVFPSRVSGDWQELPCSVHGVKIPVKDGAFQSQGRSGIQCQPQVSTLGTGWDGSWDFRGKWELCGQTQGTLGSWQQTYGSDDRVRPDKEGTCFPGHSQTKGDRLQRLWETRRDRWENQFASISLPAM